MGGTLAHELKGDPESVTLNDGRKVNVKATVKFMSFSAHSDYNQTSEFIRRLKANVVVLVHGEEHEMNRMRNKLREEYPELNVTAPQNCQTVALRVPPDRSVDAVGNLVEEIASVKKGRTEVSGMLVEDSTGARALMKPEDLGAFTGLSVCNVEQCQRFVFPQSLTTLGRALLEIYDEVEVSEGRLKVCEAVEVSLENQILCITWDSSPVNDMVADSVAFTAIEITRSPTMLTALQGDVKKEEDRIFQVLCTYMQQEFGRLKIDDSTQLVSFEVDGQAVLVNFPLRQVQAPNEALRERVTKALRRCERALRPIQAV